MRAALRVVNRHPAAFATSGAVVLQRPPARRAVGAEAGRGGRILRPMWNVLPALPAGLLGIGAVVSLVRNPSRERLSNWGPVVAAALAMVSSVALLVHLLGGAEVVTLRLPGWPEAIFGQAPFLSADVAVAWCLTLLTVVATLTMIRGTAHTGPPIIKGRALLKAAAGALLLALLRSAFGLVLGWVLLDVVLYLGAGGRRHGLLAGQLGLLLAVIGLASLPEAGFTAGASSAAGIAARPWLIAAGAVRMGVFPIWWAVPPARREHSWVSGLVRLVPTLVGACLVIQASRLGPPPADIATRLALPLAAVFFGGVLAGLSRRHGRTLDWAMTHVAGLVLLASILGDAVGEAIALLIVAEVAVGAAGAYLMPRPVSRSADNVPILVLAAGMAGFPPLLGFVARWPLYRELFARGLVGALVVTAVGTAFALAGTFRRRPARRVGPPPPPAILRRITRATSSVAAATAALEVALGLGLVLFARTLGTRGPVQLPNPVLDLTTSLQSSAGRPGALALLGLLLLPAALGVMLARTLGRTVDRGRLSGLDLTPAVDAAAGGVIHLGSQLQRASGLVEGRRALAWTLLAVIAVALVPLRAPTSATTIDARVVAILLLCAIPAATVAVAGRPSIILAALGATYVLAAGLLLSAGTPWFIAGIVILMGVFVLAILAVSVVQAPDQELRPAAAARRLAVLQGERDVGWSLVPAITVIGAAVVLAGVKSVVAADRLPDIILQASLLLGAGGVVAVVLARGPLRLSAGVLMTTTAFSLAYARLDPGLIVTGALAAFQLLFALVASYFVGDSAPERFAPVTPESDP